MEHVGKLEVQVAPLVAMLPVLNAQIVAADAALEALVAGDKRLKQLTSVPAVGTITSTAFLSVVDNAGRFGSGRQLQAYVGLVPREYSSGDKARRGSITKAGHRQLRSLLVQTALRILRTTTAAAAHLREWAKAIAARRGKKVAIVALARKLASILFAVLRDDVVFRAPPPLRAESKLLSLEDPSGTPIVSCVASSSS